MVQGQINIYKEESKSSLATTLSFCKGFLNRVKLIILYKQ
jgi:hypothetical protein